MKLFFLLSLFFISIKINAQNKTYNTNIDTANVVNVYSGKVTIGKIVVSQTLQTKIFLISIKSTKDTTGIYNTIIDLGHKENIPLFGINMLFKFSDSVISVDGGGNGSGVGTGLSDDYKEFTYIANQINRQVFGDVMLSFLIKSKTRISTTIFGIDGKYN